MLITYKVCFACLCEGAYESWALPLQPTFALCWLYFLKVREEKYWARDILYALDKRERIIRFTSQASCTMNFASGDELLDATFDISIIRAPTVTWRRAVRNIFRRHVIRMREWDDTHTGWSDIVVTIILAPIHAFSFLISFIGITITMLISFVHWLFIIDRDGFRHSRLTYFASVFIEMRFFIFFKHRGGTFSLLSSSPFLSLIFRRFSSFYYI